LTLKQVVFCKKVLKTLGGEEGMKDNKKPPTEGSVGGWSRRGETQSFLLQKPCIGTRKSIPEIELDW
jgi:hypothetical protein